MYTKLRSDRRPMPQMPWPEVHPPPRDAPKPTMKPPKQLRSMVKVAGRTSKAQGVR